MHDNTNDLFGLYQDVRTLAQRSSSRRAKSYLIGQTDRNQESVLGWATGYEGEILIPCFDNIAGYPGFSAWKESLIARGIASQRISRLPGELAEIGGKLTFNSLSEQFDLARYARDAGITEISFTAPLWQLLRSFMGAVAACREVNPDLKVSPILGLDLPWDEDTVHSQGALTGKRIDLMVSEAWRIIEYQEKGDLPLAAEVRKYMQRFY